jgi:hypothetical protein
MFGMIHPIIRNSQKQNKTNPRTRNIPRHLMLRVAIDEYRLIDKELYEKIRTVIAFDNVMSLEYSDLQF